MKTIGNVQQDAQIRAVASGTLSNGDTIIVNSDGTVSAVVETTGPATPGTSANFNTLGSSWFSAAYDANAQKVVIAYRRNSATYGSAVVGTVSGTSISFGTPVIFNGNSCDYTSMAYDANAQKVVIAHRDRSLSNYGRVVVGTVSGTSISFGSLVVFHSQNTQYISAVYDSNSQKVVIAFRDNTDGLGIVGTVSGTSISFGTRASFKTAATGYVSAAYDSNAQKVVIGFRDQGDDDKGTAVVGTVSGTSISFGTPVVFEAGDTRYISCAYDANAQKVVIGYADVGNSYYGTAIVGTVSGTSISFGSPVVFESASSSPISATYDSSTQKVAMSYTDGGNSNYGTVSVGTVSGTSISFASAVVFLTAYPDYLASTYDSDSEQVILLYSDGGNSNYGTALTLQTVSTSTTLTSDNFIGFADGAYADTQSALVNSTCTVDRNQSGLTAGQKYYVQTNGALGTTAGDPSVEAGTAISSTEIIVKG